MLQTLPEEPLPALGATGVHSAVSGNTTTGGVEAVLTQSLQEGDEYDAIIRAAQAARAKKLELERQLQEARNSAMPDQAMNMQRIAVLEDRLRQSQNELAALERTLHEREAELAAARAEKSALAGERDLYMRKHFVTAVALKGSQIQVEKRDEEGKSLLGTLANMIGLSRWRNT
ncbi:hypothetical protein FKP32DRAFT_1591434 [Trametes sanguinea]|nr:hypothetical protein FKP32DRAFT_1591434 [Trametes sanguinea]